MRTILALALCASGSSVRMSSQSDRLACASGSSVRTHSQRPRLGRCRPQWTTTQVMAGASGDDWRRLRGGMSAQAGWLTLFMAIAFELTFTGMMHKSHGFSRPTFAFLAVLFYVRRHRSQTSVL